MFTPKTQLDDDYERGLDDLETLSRCWATIRRFVRRFALIAAAATAAIVAGSWIYDAIH